VVLSLATRLLAMVVSLGSTLLTTRLLIDEVGASTYAQINLITSLIILLPFVDLGMGTAVATAVASEERPAVVRVLRTSLRCVALAGAVVAATALVLALAPGWRTLLGTSGLGENGSNAALVTVALLFAVNAPLGLGQRAMLGLHRNHVVGAVGGAQAALSLLTTWLLLRSGAPAWTYVVPVPLAMLICSASLFAWSCHLMGIPAPTLVREAVVRSRFPGTRIRGTAAAAMVITCATALAMQTDRLILSHLSNAHALAQYVLAAQLYAPIWAVVSTAGLALWPIFRRANRPGSDPSPAAALDRYVVAFVGLGIVSAAGYLLLSPLVVSVMSGGAVHLPLALRLAFAALILVQCAQVPSGMYLFGRRGLRIQAALVTGMAVLNVLLSVALIPRAGAAAPVIGSVVATLVVQLVPTYLIARSGRVPD
jgi:O-antigen/teichoic acid export membrane protein